MAWFSWFKKKDDPEDYEKILSSLAIEVQKKQTRLSEIRLRERRSTLLVTLYAFAGWAIYVAVWWAFLQHMHFWHRRYRTSENILKFTPIVLGPIIILCVRRIVQVWYSNKGNAEESTLKALLVEQRNKLEEIKKKTNYYATRNLLERYDDAQNRRAPITPNNNQLRQRNINGANTNPPQTPMMKQPPDAARCLAMQNGAAPDAAGGTASPIPTALLKPSSATPLPPPKKQWFDKFADALLGDDTSASTGDKTRYALICENCFSHNGLCREEDWEDMKYVCPRCSHFNPSPRQKRGEDRSYPHSRAQSTLARGPSVPNTAAASDTPPEYQDRVFAVDASPTAIFHPGRELSRTPPSAAAAAAYLHPPSSPLRQSHSASSSPSPSPSPSGRNPSKGRHSPSASSSEGEESGNISAMDVDVKG